MNLKAIAILSGRSLQEDQSIGRFTLPAQLDQVEFPGSVEVTEEPEEVSVRWESDGSDTDSAPRCAGGGRDGAVGKAPVWAVLFARRIPVEKRTDYAHPIELGPHLRETK